MEDTTNQNGISEAPAKIHISWVDIAKFAAIAAVYVGHYRVASERVVSFVYEYHVPFFFFIGGFFAVTGKANQSFPAIISSKTRRILIPYIFFCASIVAVFSAKSLIYGEFDITKIMDLIYASLVGDNVGYTWFLLQYYIFSILYACAYKLTESKTALLAISCSAYCFYPDIMHLLKIGGGGGGERNIFDPERLRYLIFYSFGGLLFKYVHDIQFSNGLVHKRLLSGFLLIVSAYVTLTVFYKGGSYFADLITPDKTRVLTTAFNVFQTLSIIFLHCVIAQKIPQFNILQKLGRNTLGLNGFEYHVKRLSITEHALGSGGTAFARLGTFGAIIDTAVSMLLLCYMVIPITRFVHPGLLGEKGGSRMAAFLQRR